MTNTQIKTLIELSTTIEEANRIIEEYTQYKSYSEKIAYLEILFGCSIVDRNIESEECDYIAMLSSIINLKNSIYH